MSDTHCGRAEDRPHSRREQPGAVAAGSSRSKCPIRTSRRARRKAAAPPRLLGAARGGVHRRRAADGCLRARALRRSRRRAGDAAAVPLPHSVDDRLRLDRARLAQCGAGLHPAVRRREGRHDRPAAARRAADDAHRAAVPRLSRGSGAHRRHRAGHRARAGIDGQRGGVRRVPTVRHAR